MNPDTVICVVDDDDAVRDSLMVLLETMGYAVRAYESGIAFLEDCVTVEVGCVLLDVRMPRMNGMEVQEHLREIRSDLPVIILTGHGDVTMAVQAMRAGAIDFIEKPFDEDVLLASVRNALVYAEQFNENAVKTATIEEKIDTLTPREREVFDQLIVGHSNKGVARILDCSPRTVEIHRARIFEKLQTNNIAQLVRMALSVGIEIADE